MSCCSRKRTWKDFAFLPVALITTVFGLSTLLTIEMGVAYALGLL